MRILLLTHSREAASFRVRWARYLPLLEERGHSVAVAEIPAGRRGRRAVLDRGGDLVVLQRRLLMARDFARLRRRARRLVYDYDDALCYRPRPPHRSWARARRFFRTVAAADAVIAGSRILAGVARLRRAHVHVVPSAVDVERYGPAPKLAEPTAVWIGQRATLPYLEPVLGAVQRSGFSLRVIADVFPPGAEQVAWSADTAPARLAECHVGLMPLRNDRFARGKCGYKLLQYYAAGLPAVVSPVGAGRVLAEGGALVARDPEAWEAALRRLEDLELRAELGARARSFVVRRYAADRVGARLVRLLEATGAPPPGCGASG
ncbi:MAG: glycosyltransferase [Planctomycetota bacterium]|jgi:glycosyltransferase involved in cell wall biosynthesis